MDEFNMDDQEPDNLWKKFRDWIVIPLGLVLLIAVISFISKCVL